LPIAVPTRWARSASQEADIEVVDAADVVDLFFERHLGDEGVDPAVDISG
jgi:hypothetical protein